MATGKRAGAPLLGAVALLLAAGCPRGDSASPVGGRPSREPEAWPPTNATECLRTRPPVERPISWPMAVAVRDWQQPVHDGRIEVMLCGQGPLPSSEGAEGSEPFLVMVATTGGVTTARDTGVQWTGREDIIAPLTAEVSGPGSLEVVVVPPRVDGATQIMTVYVLDVDGSLVVSECRDPASCRWD